MQQWSYEEAQVFLAQMRRELKDLKIHAYLGVTVVYGRKPGGKPESKTNSSSSGYPTSATASTTSNMPEDHQTLV
jgi:hypothetical protein